jgi:hypothetical protein
MLPQPGNQSLVVDRPIIKRATTQPPGTRPECRAKAPGVNPRGLFILTWCVLPFAYWFLVFQLAGVLPPDSKEIVLKALVILLVLLIMAGAHLFWRRRRRFLFWYYLALAVAYAVLLAIGWSDFAPLW